RPLDAFERFDDFFTRPHQPGARPIAEGEGVVVSPVDGTVSEVGIAEGGRLLQCKGRDYTLRGLLADADEARHFEGGSYATFHLGSTVILVFERARVQLELKSGDAVRVGQRVGQRSANARERAA